MNILGPYCSFWHWRGKDQEYIHRLQPAWARIHQPTARAIHWVQQASPNTKIMLRCWDIDDKDGQRKREMYDDPVRAAHLHMAMWEAKLIELENELRVNGWVYDKSNWHMGLVNEPDPAFVPQVVDYSLEAMRIANQRAWHLGLVCSSVGTFSKPSENDRGWALCKPLEAPINDGGHILIVHEYWQPEGPSYGEDAGNLAWRHRHIPLDVPILVGESGANGYIYGRYSKQDDAGWQKHVANPKPQTFAAQVKEYIEGCDERVKGVLLYMLDFHSEQWWSFDTNPAMEELLAIKDSRPQRKSPFIIHLPNITNGNNTISPQAQPRFEQGDLVRTTTVVNARRTPGTNSKAADDILARLSPDTPMELLEGPQHADGLVWWRTAQGWVAEVAPNGMTLLTTKVDAPVDVEPQPIPSGAINPQVAEAVLQVESGHNAFSEGRLVIRLELHLFRRYLGDNALFDTYFYHDPQQGHLDQKWRRSPHDAWQPAHLDSRVFATNQRHEWKVFGLAAKLDRHAALMSISMGAPQIMGFNHVRIGYASPEAMFNAFQRSEAVQIIGFFNYCISDPALFAAMRQGHWTEIAKRYNGDSAQVPTYVQLMKSAYQRILGA